MSTPHRDEPLDRKIVPAGYRTLLRMNRQPARIAAGILVWTFVAWGGRIGLLTDDDGWADLVRIGGSLLVGLATAVALAVPSVRLRAVPPLYIFCVWTSFLWGRSLVVNWTGTGSLPFKLVHTVLAVGFLIVVVSVWGFARESAKKREGRPVGTGSSSPA